MWLPTIPDIPRCGVCQCYHPLSILQERRVNGRLRGQLWFAACCSVPRCCATASARVVMCGACRALPFSDQLLDGFPMMLPQFLQGIWMILHSSYDHCSQFNIYIYIYFIFLNVHLVYLIKSFSIFLILRPANLCIDPVFSCDLS